MKYRVNILWSLLLCMTLAMISCKEDAEVEEKMEDEPVLSTINEELNVALYNLGFTYDESGELVVDEKVSECTSLDLSSCSLKSTSGIEVFTALESIDLSSNNFGEQIDFSYLPASLKSIDLRGNEDVVFYYKLAATVGGKVRLSSLTKLVLPTSANENFTDIAALLQTSVGKSATISIDNGGGDGGTTPYATLREVPSAALREYLQGLYPSLFATTGEIDLTQSITDKADLYLSDKYDDLTGVEYIVSNPSFSGGSDGAISIIMAEESPWTIDAIRLSQYVKRLTLINVDVANIRLSDAHSLVMCRVGSNDVVESLELPTTFMKSSSSGTSIYDNEIYICSMPKLKELIMPTVTGAVGKITIQSLPSLEALDLSMVNMVHTIVMSELDGATITPPAALSGYLDGWGGESVEKRLSVSIDDVVRGKLVTFLDLVAEEGADIIDESSYYLE